MIILATETRRLARLTKWHRWFAWHPVTTLDGQRVFLKTIYRKAFTMTLGLERDFQLLYSLSLPDEDSSTPLSS